MFYKGSFHVQNYKGRLLTLHLTDESIRLALRLKQESHQKGIDFGPIDLKGYQSWLSVR